MVGPTPVVATPLQTSVAATSTAIQPAKPESSSPATATAPANLNPLPVATTAASSTPLPPAAASVEAPLPSPVAPAVPPAVVAATPPISSGPTTVALATTIATPATEPVKSADAPQPKWRDGKFSGWGYCRHGEIEATLEIKDGRIISAVISRCQTRYSCDVISHLVPQVVARQSADVDTVSGATQSADSFYGAVVAALASAKPEPVKTL
jgi:uncharacterized protein with FMN-binding domain